MDNGMTPPTSSPAQAVKILVVDDHPMIRRGIASLINASEGLECVAEASMDKRRSRFALAQKSILS